MWLLSKESFTRVGPLKHIKNIAFGISVCKIQTLGSSCKLPIMWQWVQKRITIITVISYGLEL